MKKCELMECWQVIPCRAMSVELNFHYAWKGVTAVASCPKGVIKIRDCALGLLAGNFLSLVADCDLLVKVNHAVVQVYREP